jgi:hypothetical protein
MGVVWFEGHSACVACTEMFERREPRNDLATAFVLPLVFCLCEGGGASICQATAPLVPRPR